MRCIYYIKYPTMAGHNGFVTWWSNTIHVISLTDSEACGRHVLTIDKALQQLGDADKNRMNNSFSISYFIDLHWEGRESIK